ncbi:molybdenum cofactor sulfurase 1 isoform X2 [Adelges cooleyi]|uniref:molybdenum cofactor sulfurase 1 isoform X2 n=1 Tax=Adelges cooleyi TaxID=133065 RepID=UPI0021807249|nr:molybdenum cofactor sulfurase 1 isoform X2 [Adelges cooleyi]
MKKTIDVSKTSKSIRNQFERLRGICYLDHAGSALYADSQIDAVMFDLKTNLYGNPHSSGQPSTACEEIIDRVRFKILKHFNTNTEKYSVIFTSGATGALKTVAECFAWHDKCHQSNEHASDCQWQGSAFAYTQDNHTSVLGMRELAENVQDVCLTRIQISDAPNTDLSVCPKSGNSLFVYPAQSNFSGYKYPLSWIRKCQNGALDRYTENSGSKWYVLLDAASHVSTDYLDLSEYSPDFVAVSFYKMFGYPTGIGALLVHNRTGANALNRKRYYGGGTVEITLARNRHHVPKTTTLHEWFEDGTVDFLSIIAIDHGLNTLRELAGPMQSVSQRVFELAAYLYAKMCTARHGNQKPLFRIYTDSDYTCREFQGGVVNFNVLRANGEHVGYNEVRNVADNNGIVLRVGCFCNPGACQTHLNLSDQQIQNNHQKTGHVCGDDIDLIDGTPTGSVRVSFGYQSCVSDADTMYNIMVKYFWQSDVVRPVDFRMLTTLNDNSNNLRVSRIFVYPIKSCGSVEVNQWPLESYGLLYDRVWTVLSEDGVCMTQLKEPKLCLIQPEIDLFKGIMTLTYAGNSDRSPMKIYLESQQLDIKRAGKTCTGDLVDGLDCGDEVASWLSFNLDMPGLRLIRCTNRSPSKSNKFVLAANQCQYLMTTESTVNWLRRELKDDNTDLDLDSVLFRFRSNILVAGDSPVNSEVNWTEVTMGGIKFQVHSVCVRCKMICIDQSNSLKNHKPLSILDQHKWNGKSVFGIYLNRVEETLAGYIRVGQPVSFV